MWGALDGVDVHLRIPHAEGGAARAAGLRLRVDDAVRGPGRGRALRRVDPVDVIHTLPRFPLDDDREV